jgi:DNA ligase-associated metallophosphoesterase
MAAGASLAVGPLTLVADASGALVDADERILLVADLHLEKGSAYAARGVLLPPYDSRATLALLEEAVRRWRPRLVVALGDTLHDRAAAARIAADDLATLAGLQAGRDWIWLTGNHDPDPVPAMGGTVAAELALAGVMLRHEPRAGETGPEIAGHLHPAGKVRLRGRAVRRRCFVSDGRRCVMPAFGTYAGGLNVLDGAFSPLFAGRRFTAHMLGAGRVYAVAGHQLSPD